MRRRAAWAVLFVWVTVFGFVSFVEKRELVCLYVVRNYKIAPVYFMQRSVREDIPVFDMPDEICATCFSGVSGNVFHGQASGQKKHLSSRADQCWSGQGRRDGKNRAVSYQTWHSLYRIDDEPTSEQFGVGATSIFEMRVQLPSDLLSAFEGWGGPGLVETDIRGELDDSEGALSPHFSHLTFKGRQLVAHNVPLFRSVVVSNPYGTYANGSSVPQPEHLRFVPAPLAFVFGSLFILGACKFLNHTFDRSGYLFFLGVFGGFVPFSIGFLLILFCLLASPPTIFGFTVQHFPLPWTD